MHLKTSSEKVACCKYLLTSLTDVNIETNRVDPYQTAPMEQSDLGLYCLTKRLLNISADDLLSSAEGSAYVILTCNTDRLTLECEINISLQ